jgi:hypothetical protein
MKQDGMINMFGLEDDLRDELDLVKKKLKYTILVFFLVISFFVSYILLFCNCEN